uniref:ShKT domain-containing protein n=1 Tax=Parascaris univalens TaxID=6257 RepID=A0A915AR12_PARUN
SLDSQSIMLKYRKLEIRDTEDNDGTNASRFFFHKMYFLHLTAADEGSPQLVFRCHYFSDDMEMKYRQSIALVIASVVLCASESEVKICDSHDHLICQAPGISFMCSVFSFMRQDCPRLCGQCTDAITNTTTQKTTMNITVSPTVRQIDSTVTASTFSTESTSANTGNTISTKVAAEQLERFNSTTKSERDNTKTTVQNQTLTTATADHIYPSFAVFTFIFTGILQL